MDPCTALSMGSLHLFTLPKSGVAHAPLQHLIPPEMVIHRAMYFLQNGFGSYDVFHNNCEDFALYCKTGLLVLQESAFGRSSQVSYAIGALLAALLSAPLRLLMRDPVSVVTGMAGMYCMHRYSADIGVRMDVTKVAVEDMAANLGWAGCCDEVVEKDKQGSNKQIAQNSKGVSIM